MKEQLAKLGRFLKNNANLLIFKFVLGFVDVTTDLVSGHNFISGQFLLGLYFASKTREEFNNNNQDYTPWGLLTIFFVWFPGLLRILNMSSDQTWRGVPAKTIAKRVSGYFVLLIVWPIFSLLMYVK